MLKRSVKARIVTLERSFIPVRQHRCELHEILGQTGPRHSKCVTFQLADVAFTRHVFAAILARIERRSIPPQVIVGRVAAYEIRNAKKTLTSGKHLEKSTMR
jgi:hypothetical protein